MQLREGIRIPPTASRFFFFRYLHAAFRDQFTLSITFRFSGSSSSSLSEKICLSIGCNLLGLGRSFESKLCSMTSPYKDMKVFSVNSENSSKPSIGSHMALLVDCVVLVMM